MSSSQQQISPFENSGHVRSLRRNLDFFVHFASPVFGSTGSQISSQSSGYSSQISSQSSGYGSLCGSQASSQASNRSECDLFDNCHDSTFELYSSQSIPCGDGESEANFEEENLIAPPKNQPGYDSTLILHKAALHRIRSAENQQNAVIVRKDELIIDEDMIENGINVAPPIILRLKTTHTATKRKRKNKCPFVRTARKRHKPKKKSKPTGKAPKPKMAISKFFSADLEQLIRYRLIEPQAHKLQYEDPDGGQHEAILLSNGRVKIYYVDYGVTFDKLEDWLRSILNMSRRQKAGLDNESKRVRFGGATMLTLMRQMWQMEFVY